MLDLSYLPDSPDTGDWKEGHRAAIAKGLALTPHVNGFEASVVAAFGAWLSYARSHADRYESPIGQDYVLGPAWALWGSALRELLNGETGRLDCGTLDHILVANLTEQGFDIDQI